MASSERNIITADVYVCSLGASQAVHDSIAVATHTKRAKVIGIGSVVDVTTRHFRTRGAATMTRSVASSRSMAVVDSVGMLVMRSDGRGSQNAGPREQSSHERFVG